MTGWWNNNPSVYDFRKIMRKLMVHPVHLPSSAGNCAVLDEPREDNTQSSTLSDLLLSHNEDTTLYTDIDIPDREKCSLGYIAG